MLHQRSCLEARWAQDKKQLLLITCYPDRVLKPLQDPRRHSAPAFLSLAKYRKVQHGCGSAQQTVPLCLLRAHLCPQAACNHAWLSRARRERQHIIEMPQWPLTAYSKNSDSAVRYCSNSGCHLPPFLLLGWLLEENFLYTKNS